MAVCLPILPMAPMKGASEYPLRNPQSMSDGFLISWVGILLRWTCQHSIVWKNWMPTVPLILNRGGAWRVSPCDCWCKCPFFHRWETHPSHVVVLFFRSFRYGSHFMVCHVIMTAVLWLPPMTFVQNSKCVHWPSKVGGSWFTKLDEANITARSCVSFLVLWSLHF